MSRYFGLGAVWVVLNVFFIASAQSGSHAIFETVQGSDKGQTVILASGQHLKLSHQQKSSAVVMLYDQAKQEILILDEKAKHYLRFDKKTMAQFSQQMMAMKNAMKSQLAMLPPAQQESMKKMLGGKMSGFFEENKPANVRYNVTKKQSDGAPWPCQITEKLRDGIKSKEFCLTPTDKIAGADEVFFLMKNMMQLLEGIVAEMPLGAYDTPFADMQSMTGFPVVMKHFEKDGVSQEMRLISLKKQAIEKSVFDIPKGYQEKSMDLRSMFRH